MEELDKITVFRAFIEEFEEPSQEEIDRIVQELKRRKDQVNYLLQKYPDARSHDFLLQWLWLQIFGKFKIPQIHWEVICKFSGALEGVRRARQKIQNEEGRLLPLDPKIREMRRRRSEAYRKAVKRV